MLYVEMRMKVSIARFYKIYGKFPYISNPPGFTDTLFWIQWIGKIN